MRKAYQTTYEHATDDGKVWELTGTIEPYHAGTYWDPPEGGYCLIEGDAVEQLKTGEHGPAETVDLDAWRGRYGIDDRAWNYIEEKAFEDDAANDYACEED